MSIIQKLTLAHLKRNKGRTVVTTLGICVSVAMITAVFVCIASFMNYMGNVTLYSSGNCHVRVYGVTETETNELKSTDGVSKVGLVAVLPPEKKALKLITAFLTGLLRVRYMQRIKMRSASLLLVM